LDVVTQFAVYDVFADRPFSGNPAAVIRAGRKRYSDAQLVTLAGELAFSEIAESRNAGRILSIRFATADRIVDRCGHATLAAVADRFFLKRGRQGHNGFAKAGAYRVGQAEACWKIANVPQKDGSSPGLYLDVTICWPDKPFFVAPLPIRKIYDAVGLNLRDGIPEFSPVVYDSGNRNALVSLRGISQLKRAKPNWSKLKPLFDKYKLTDMHLFCHSPRRRVGDTIYFRCRNIFPYGAFEETATGTASVALSVCLADRLTKCGGREPPTTFSFEQGIGERRGKLLVKLEKKKEHSTIWLTGRVFPISRGRLFVKPPWDGNI
jgi:predicted PhzF superfamily epimerase YddE/YHI9